MAKKKTPKKDAEKKILPTTPPELDKTPQEVPEETAKKPPARTLTVNQMLKKVSQRIISIPAYDHQAFAQLTYAFNNLMKLKLKDQEVKLLKKELNEIKEALGMEEASKKRRKKSNKVYLGKAKK